MYFLRLLRRSGQPGADSPDRLVSHHTHCQTTHTKGVEYRLQLTSNNRSRFAGIALGLGFTHTEHWTQTASQGCSKLLTNHLVGLTEIRSALGVTHKYKFTPGIPQLRWRYLASQGTRLSLSSAGLPCYANRRRLQALITLTDKQCRRRHHQLDLIRPVLRGKLFQQRIYRLP